MKKIGLLLSLAFLTFSCSDDDDSSSSLSNTDLVGTWSLSSESQGGEDQPLNDCELLSSVTFTDVLFTEVDSRMSDLDGECFDFEDTENYSLDGDVLFYTADYEGEEEEVFVGEISIAGDELTIDDEEVYGDEIFGSVRVYTLVGE